MKLTLLLDLDDTLIESNMQNFIPAYFQALSGYLKDFIEPGKMVQALLGGTKKMMEKIDPERFLCDVFDENFYPMIGVDRSFLRPRIDQFYDEIFPDLKDLTKQLPAAIDFVNWAISDDIRVVIATNPLFPSKAIHHRLRWAGVAPEEYPYAYVTNYENSHFTKENIAYFPEIMGHLGWPDDPVVMIGNDLKMDIEPAMAAGFPVFWVHNSVVGSQEREEIPQGNIDDVRAWLESGILESLQHSTQKPSAVLATLRSTPAVLEGLFSDLSVETMGSRIDPQEWSITEVICHLRDVEIEVNLPRIQKVLSQENSFVAGISTDPWVLERNYANQSGTEALQEFIKARKRTLDELDHLHSEWEKSLRHSIFGSSNLLELVNVIVGHDKAHIQQIHHVKNHLR